ncbi:Hypothetical protein FP1843 [Flavobacterium psychrophilum JIP02/86]|uniref:Uncharacterized protein n=1 Tax=Flavobacterium psychrophilum (strain ATCC 49511 / DSM 21280 / CIP 103535 / JIP02/86) TaxID=402612 RepID=A6H0N5_FLAPJ|nr:hypothetical protein [Flavobacterium psychrophilum]QGS64277.1 hypothetical protein GMY06_10740 [Flavobacterium psychrophilum]CAL43909.1 Hypothetical protein FP1843 [Flavobacterium psychrophilum JIP02/86]
MAVSFFYSLDDVTGYKFSLQFYHSFITKLFFTGFSSRQYGVIVISIMFRISLYLSSNER